MTKQSPKKSLDLVQLKYLQSRSHVLSYIELSKRLSFWLIWKVCSELIYYPYLVSRK